MSGKEQILPAVEETDNNNNVIESQKQQKKREAEIRRSYLNKRFSGAFSGLSGFVQNRKKWTDKNEVVKELRKLDAYTLHRDVRKKFKRRRIMVHFINEIFCSDLKDISNISKWNNNNHFVLIVLDAFSKMAWTRPLKSKSAAHMIRGFKSIFKEAGAIPHFLFTDRGLEYTSTAFSRFLQKHNIVRYHIYSHIKSSHCERVIRSLFTKLERYKTEHKTNKIVDVLQDFTKAYNSSYHTTIKTQPNLVTKDNEGEIWEIMFKDLINADKSQKPAVPPKFQVGDQVRITREKLQFEKGKKINFFEDII